MTFIIAQIKRLHRLYILHKFAEETCPLCDGETMFYDPNREHISERSFECKMCGGKGKVSDEKYKEWQSQIPKKEKPILPDYRIPLKQYIKNKLDEFIGMLPQVVTSKIHDFDSKVAILYKDVEKESSFMYEHMRFLSDKIVDTMYIEKDKRGKDAIEMADFINSQKYDTLLMEMLRISCFFNSSKKHSMEIALERYDLEDKISDLKKYTTGIFE